MPIFVRARVSAYDERKILLRRTFIGTHFICMPPLQTWLEHEELAIDICMFMPIRIARFVYKETPALIKKNTKKLLHYCPLSHRTLIIHLFSHDSIAPHLELECLPSGHVDKGV